LFEQQVKILPRQGTVVTAFM